MVGRKYDSPGLIVVSFSQSKPRDRSHYERFRSYHQRLYAQVEPTSVTPFSPPAIDRALHAIVVSAVRQLGNENEALSPRPFPLVKTSQLRETIEKLIRDRTNIVDKDEIANVLKILDRRIKEWDAWDPSVYGGFGPPPENPPLIYPAGSLELPEWDGHSWPTLNSLRDVDATCEAQITSFYNEI